MSDARPIDGWCFLCNRAIDGDMGDHVTQDHPAPSRKIKSPKISWEHRLNNVVTMLQGIPNEPDAGTRIDQLDEVLQELYLVRAKLAQLKGTPVMRVKEGS